VFACIGLICIKLDAEHGNDSPATVQPFIVFADGMKGDERH